VTSLVPNTRVLTFSPLDHKLSHVPGTVLLNDEAAHSESQTGNLKHGTGKNSHIVLSPQPSDDPNDPLNWSLLKKESIVWILAFGSMLCAATNVSHFGLAFDECYRV
jgi:hypothetical protein